MKKRQRRKFWVENFGVVGLKKARDIMKHSHITVVREVTGYDMRKVHHEAPLPGYNRYRGEI